MKLYKKLILAIASAFIVPYIAAAQYTETINTNNPGQSQGAFAVGTNVYQVETSAFYRNEQHSLFNFERDILGLAFQLRYGVWKEQLEISYFGTFENVNETINRGFGPQENSFSNFSRSTLGVKYLIFDPIKKWGEREVNLYSYHDNRKLKWRDIVPAVSLFAGANLDLSSPNSLIPPDNATISPRLELITQNNFGPWVFVTNFIADRIGTEFPAYGGIFTLTHSINGKWAVFGEAQTVISDFYSDDIARAGGAFLINRNWQVDASAAINFKDTPGIYQINVGMSYRIDRHRDPVLQK